MTSTDSSTTTATGATAQIGTLYTPSFLTPSIPSTSAVELPEPVDGEQRENSNILYLAYGSNLNSTTFQGRRGIKPVSATVVVVPELRLTFNLPGVPYVEPCFGNVRLVGKSSGSQSASTPLLLDGKQEEEEGDMGDPDPPLVGVVYEVTAEDYRTIIATEGGGSSYADFVVDCYTIPASPTTTATLLKAHTLLAPTDKTRHKGGQASARYLGLITAGAEQHGFPQSYKSYLARYKPYTITTLRQHVGRVVFSALWMPMLLTVFALARLIAGPDGRVPGWLRRIQGGVFSGMWLSYDSVFKGVFGNGEGTAAGGLAFAGEKM